MLFLPTIWPDLRDYLTGPCWLLAVGSSELSTDSLKYLLGRLRKSQKDETVVQAYPDIFSPYHLCKMRSIIFKILEIL